MKGLIFLLGYPYQVLHFKIGPSSTLDILSTYWDGDGDRETVIVIIVGCAVVSDVVYDDTVAYLIVQVAIFWHALALALERGVSFIAMSHKHDIEKPRISLVYKIGNLHLLLFTHILHIGP